MPLMQPDEMRTFAGALPHPDFSHASGGLPVKLSGLMDELASPNEFIAAWAPKLVGFGNDFRHGIDAFGSIAQQAADRFEATDANHGAIMSDLVNGARTDQNSAESGGLESLPHTRPPVSPADQPNRPDEPSDVSRPSSLQLGLPPGLDIDHIPPGMGAGR